MNIESLKELLDGFDPAAFLPDISSTLGKVELLVRVCVNAGPIVLLVLGLLYLFASPREANYYFGYRCYFGMGSVEAWRFSQRLAGITMGAMGLVLTTVMLLISNGFRGMEVMPMVEKGILCLVWQGGAVVIGVLFINIFTAIRFDRKGERRGRKTEEKETAAV